MNKRHCVGCFYYRKLGYKNLMACHYLLDTGKAISLIDGAGPNSEYCIARKSPSQVKMDLRRKAMEAAIQNPPKRCRKRDANDEIQPDRA